MYPGVWLLRSLSKLPSNWKSENTNVEVDISDTKHTKSEDTYEIWEQKRDAKISRKVNVRTQSFYLSFPQ